MRPLTDTARFISQLMFEEDRTRLTVGDIARYFNELTGRDVAAVEVDASLGALADRGMVICDRGTWRPSHAHPANAPVAY